MHAATSPIPSRVFSSLLPVALAASCLVVAATAQGATPVTGVITTIAGNGTIGVGGDGGPGTAAQLNYPSGTAVDGAGNVYIADVNNHRIRKIAAGTGAISTVAGTGVAGFLGDGGPATAARIYYPQGVAVDTDGNVYIVDKYNHRIRKITVATGVITTVAGNGTLGFGGDGGAATAAQLYYPHAVAVDAAGNLYIADLNNYRIRKVTAANGIISTVAGTGTAGYNGDGPATGANLNQPFGVAVDAAGNVYIADTYNHRVRKVAAGTGLISTVAGTGVAGFLGEAGPATTARLYYPVGVAVDGAGDVYITDQNNHRIRKLTVASGIITTVAGSGTLGFGGDTGVAQAALLNYPQTTAVDGLGNLYIADQYNHRIRKVAAPTVPAQVMKTVAGTGTAGYNGDGAATSANLNQPYGVAVDGAGNVYIADSYNHRIRKVAAATGLISTVAGTGVAGYAGEAGPATAARLYYPAGITADAAGNVYIADQYNQRVRKLTVATGIITTVAGTGIAGSAGDGLVATTAQLYYPLSVAVDGAGNVYIADQYNHRIRKVTAATGIITTVAGNGTAGVGGDGGLATLAQLNYPGAVAVDAAGNVYIGDTNNHRIRKVTAATGVISTFAGTGTAGYDGESQPATAARLYGPTGLAVDSTGDVYIADQTIDRIRKITVATGIIATVAGSGTGAYGGDGGIATAAQLNGPASVAVDAGGSLYIADFGNSRIRKAGLPLTAPVLTSVIASATSLRLNWTPSPGAGSYTVRRGISSGGEIVVASGIAGTSFVDSGLTTGQTYYYYVTAVSGGDSADSNEIARRVALAVVKSDFDGDGRSDVTVYRPSTGIWYVRNVVTGQYEFYQWGLNGDIPVAADYDGDGRVDSAVWRPSTGIWYIRNSRDGSLAFLQWGLTGDIPVPGDFDGDGKADAAVFRPSTGIWYVRDLVTNTAFFYQWGLAGDIPVEADYDGDGRTDVAVYRPSTGIWYIRNSSNGGLVFLQWGLPGSNDIPVPGDYDGDGMADSAVFRPSTGIWYVRDLVTNTANFYQWGLAGDLPVPGDFDGDGKTDVSVYRPSTGIWYVRPSGNPGAPGFYQWGLPGDIPALAGP